MRNTLSCPFSSSSALSVGRVRALPSHQIGLNVREVSCRRLIGACTATGPTSSSSSEEGDRTERAAPHTRSLKKEAQRSNQEVYDKLIDVFYKKKSSPDDWKKLIVYSAQWPTLAPGVFARLDQLADENYDDDPDGQLDLRRFKRRLEGVSDSMAGHFALLEEFRGSSSAEWEGLVAARRKLMGPDFFEYIELRIRATLAAGARRSSQEGGDRGDRGDQKDGQGDGQGGGKMGMGQQVDEGEAVYQEAEQLAALGTQLSVMVDAYDKVIQDTEALDSASQNFADLLQSESMEKAEAKLDELAATGKLDPALLLTMAKAYSGVKETDITKEEVKDIMAHLYFKAKEKFASQAPPEARILKFLLSVEGESERISLLEQAFQPGPELATASEDYLHTTPNALLNTIENILMVYDSSGSGAKARAVMEGASSGPSSMAGQAASLMNPEIIEKMRGLRDLIRKRY